MMSNPAFGIYFRVLVRQRCSLDELAILVTKTVGCSLLPSDERGIAADYVGEAFGMWLHLHASYSEKFNQNFVDNEGTLFAFTGRSLFEEDRDISWTSISNYVAQILTERTNLPWYTSEHSSERGAD